MNLSQIQYKNEKLQEAAARMTEFMPGVNLVSLTTMIIRSAGRVNTLFPKLFGAKRESQFVAILEKMEEEMDEIIYALDKMAMLNKKPNVKAINDFVKYGYDLLSIYSLACDKIIESRVKKEEY